MVHQTLIRASDESLLHVVICLIVRCKNDFKFVPHQQTIRAEIRLHVSRLTTNHASSLLRSSKVIWTWIVFAIGNSFIKVHWSWTEISSYLLWNHWLKRLLNRVNFCCHKRSSNWAFFAAFTAHVMDGVRKFQVHLTTQDQLSELVVWGLKIEWDLNTAIKAESNDGLMLNWCLFSFQALPHN